LKVAFPCGQTLQRGGHRIEAALETIHAVEKRLWIELPLRFEVPDAMAGTPPGDAEADGTNPEDLRRHEQRAQEKARRIHVAVPLVGVWRPNAPRLSCAALLRGRDDLMCGARQYVGAQMEFCQGRAASASTAS
jgi:hypothetical protein